MARKDVAASQAWRNPAASEGQRSNTEAVGTEFAAALAAASIDAKAIQRRTQEEDEDDDEKDDDEKEVGGDSGKLGPILGYYLHADETREGDGKSLERE